MLDVPSDWRRGGGWEPEVRAAFPPDDRAVQFEEPRQWCLRRIQADMSDNPWLELDVQPVSYNVVRLVADAFDDILNCGGSDRNLFTLEPVAYLNSIVVHLSVITEDVYLVMGHRSSSPRFYENCWATTFEEHMRTDDAAANPFEAARRGLSEELVGRHTIHLAPGATQFYSAFREYDRWTNSVKRTSFWDINVGLCGSVAVPFGIHDLLRNWQYLAEDGKAEFNYLVGVPFEYEALKELLLARSLPLDRLRGPCVLPDAGRDKS